MAISNWEALAIKNGRVMNRNCMYQDMLSMVGWEDTVDDYYYPGTAFICHTFKACSSKIVAIGDEDLTLGFYKNEIHVYINKEWQYEYHLDRTNKSFVDRLTFRVYHNGFEEEVNAKVKYLCDLTYLFSMKYKGDWYNVIFGMDISTSPYNWEVMKKTRWCTKRDARKIDNLLRRLIKDDGKKVLIDIDEGENTEIITAIKEYMIDPTYGKRYSGEGYVVGDNDDMVYLVNLVYNIYIANNVLESIDFENVFSKSYSIERLARDLNSKVGYKRFIVKYVSDLEYNESYINYSYYHPSKYFNYDYY